jgi:prepilin-type processing-associated H-X9-DG protein/prepilin-type N-terminal cleavage/methylation domain-containing protein
MWWVRTSPSSCSSGLRGRPAFTLVELLITITIIAVLVALLLPAARGSIGAARGFKCQTSQRSVAFDFGLFADETLHPFRGDDESTDPAIRGPLALGQFHLATFIESQYSIDEFWPDPTTNTIHLPDVNGRDPMRCAEVKGDVTLRRGLPCTQGAVTPPQNVSFGFNMRLHLSDRRWQAGDPNPVGLSYQVFSSAEVTPSSIPLLWDVDGAVAGQRSAVPLLSAPALDSPALFAGDHYWYPAQRHNGAVNVAFVDGHVAASRTPLLERTWAWGFDPGR